MKTSLVEEATALEVDSAGNIVRLDDEVSVLGIPAELSRVDMVWKAEHRRDHVSQSTFHNLMACQLLSLSPVYQVNHGSEDQIAGGEDGDEVLCIDPALLAILPPSKSSSPIKVPGALGDRPRPLVANSDPDAFVFEAEPATLGVHASAATRQSALTTPRARAPAGSHVSPPATPIRRTASQALRDHAFGTSDDELSEADVLPDPSEPALESAPNLGSGKNLEVRTTVRLNKGRVLDSDDELPVSTPTKPQVKKSQKKAVVISDDEIEDVVSSAKPRVSRRRSTLQMTAVPKAPSMHLRSAVSKSGSAKNLPLTGNLSKAFSANDPGRAESPIRLDLDDTPIPSQTTKTTVGRKRAAKVSSKGAQTEDTDSATLIDSAQSKVMPKKNNGKQAENQGTSASLQK